MYRKIGRRILTCDKFLTSGFNQFTSFRIETTGTPLNILLIYRPPSSNVENLDKLCELLKNLDKNTLILGDFNLPGIDWINLTSDSRGRRLVETVEEEGLDQLVGFPTHLKGNILDLVLSNITEKTVRVEESGRLGRSDHCIIKIEVYAELKIKNTVKRRFNWGRADWDSMR